MEIPHTAARSDDEGSMSINRSMAPKELAAYWDRNVAVYATRFGAEAAAKHFSIEVATAEYVLKTRIDKTAKRKSA